MVSAPASLASVEGDDDATAAGAAGAAAACRRSTNDVATDSRSKVTAASASLGAGLSRL